MSEQNQNPTGVPQEPQPQQLPPAQPTAQVYLPPPSATAPANYVPVATQTTNIWAVVSLVSSVLSWLGLFGIGGIIGIIAGVVARNEIAASRGTQGGDGIALAGIILGAINVLLSCIGLMCAFAFILIPLGMIPFAVGR
jgi:hypothetical protein